jgi:hypothetical protein
MKCELMLTYVTPAYMFNVYKNQLSRQTGSRNLTGPQTLPTIWHTYMKLMTKYQISAINSCREKCDEKSTIVFHLAMCYAVQQPMFILNLLVILIFIPPLLRRGTYCFTSVRPSVSLSFCPYKIFFVAFFSATIDGRNLIFGHKLHIGMPYCGKRLWTQTHCQVKYNGRDTA